MAAFLPKDQKCGKPHFYVQPYVRLPPRRSEMAEDQIKRFERWRKRLPETATYLVSLVLNEIVPVFESKGLQRYPDYAGHSDYAGGPNTIPLQRRTGAEWPTVELLFHKRFRPSLGVNFSMLPAKCHRYTLDGPIDIPRIEASVVEGPVFFFLCKGTGRNFDCNFGYRWVAFRPKQKLRNEVDRLKSLLPHIFKVFDDGIPDSWLAKRVGFVNRHIFINPGAASR